MPTSAQKRLKGLVSIGESLTWSRCPTAINQKTVDVLTEVFKCEYASVYLLAVSGDYLIQHVACGDLPNHVQSDNRISISTGRMLDMLTTHQPIVMDFLYPDPADRIPDSVMFRSAASVPLLAGDDMLGMFTVVYAKHYRWSQQDIDYLLDVGKLLGVAVQHAQIARKNTDLEILLERKRLSGELHDHLSQLIGALNMNAETALLSWEQDDAERLRRDLERIRHTSQEAVRMLREEMLSLRLPVDETKGLIPQIRECIGLFEKQWRIDTDLQLEAGLESIVVSNQMELQFIRILHEALSNVLRHATASHVSVQLQREQNRLCMQVHDNGRGFDPEAVSSQRLGLRIMCERAESLGGELTIESSNGTGTTIRVDVPQHITAGINKHDLRKSHSVIGG